MLQQNKNNEKNNAINSLMAVNTIREYHMQSTLLCTVRLRAALTAKLIEV